jgi:hypothetical protein
MARAIHRFNSEHRESQEKIMRVGFAAKLILWNYLWFLQISATRINLNLKGYLKHFQKS